MAFVTPDEVRAVIGDQYTDDQINAWLDAVCDILYTILDVDSLEIATYTDEWQTVLGTCFQVRNFNIDEAAPFTVKTCDGTDITNDYVWQFKGKRTVNVLNDDGCRVCLPYNEIKVSYTAGYNPVPQQLKNVVSLMIKGSLTTPDQMSGVVQYSVGSKSVTYRDGMDAMLGQSIIKSYLKGYLKANILCV